MVSVSAYHKRIRDIILTRIALQGGAWTATPDNHGGATARGLEFEGRITRGPLAARVNLARNWSRLDSVPGPDNRIEDQPAWSGNLGLDFSAPSGRLEAGGTFSYRGTVASRAGSPVFSLDAPRRQLDLYALWKFDAQARLRLALSNLGQRSYRERLVYEGAAPLARTSLYQVRPTVRLVWEQSL
jgi:outer membrane receptor protein involved in Fe transport